ncbi:hypothetical protein K438DRAFT_1770264 [Mycena galopus ATCC 62051]|nr:hypothetical protein K438DRAFT_1770264 [Mycena galopus ATCC 62051]
MYGRMIGTAFGLLLLALISSGGGVVGKDMGGRSSQQKMESIRITTRATATDFVPETKHLKPTPIRLVIPPASPETTAAVDVPSRPSSPRSEWDAILPRPAPMTLREIVLPVLPRASAPVLPAELLGPVVSYEEYLEEKEPEHRAANELVCLAKAAADADPTNKLKELEFKWKAKAEDYALDYGLFVPDREVVVHVLGEAQEHQRVQELRLEAGEHKFRNLEGMNTLNVRLVLTGCPFENPDPIERYDEAAYDFQRKYGRVFTSNDVWETTDVEEEWKIVGKEWHGFKFTNPFAMGTERRLALDTEFRTIMAAFHEISLSEYRSTLDKPMVGFVIRNKDYLKPWSVECLKRFCQCFTVLLNCEVWILKDDLEALEKRASEEANRMSTLSTEGFATMLRELFGEGKK